MVRYRHTEPLARAGGDLGLPGGQGCLRREAGLAQYSGRAAPGRGGAEVPANRPARGAVTQLGSTTGGCRSAAQGRDRPGLRRRAGIGVSLAAFEIGRKVTRIRRRTSITTCGRGRPRSGRSRRNVVALQLALALGLRQRRCRGLLQVFTRWTCACGASEWDCRRRSPSMGGRFLFDDDKETPEVLSSSYLYPAQKKMIQFEVSGTSVHQSGGRTRRWAIFFMDRKGIWW